MQASILEMLADKGELLYLRNRCRPFSSFIITDKIRLLQKVNGTLFAPRFFQEHCLVASNTGIVPLCYIQEILPNYDREILLAFLTSLQYCFPV